jgi:hypothetical protein
VLAGVTPLTAVKLAATPAQTVDPDTIGVGVGITVMVLVIEQVLVAGFVPVLVAIAVYTPLAVTGIFGITVLPEAAVKPPGPFHITLVILVAVITDNVAGLVEHKVAVALAVNVHNIPQFVTAAPGALALVWLKLIFWVTLE